MKVYVIDQAKSEFGTWAEEARSFGQAAIAQTEFDRLNREQPGRFVMDEVDSDEAAGVYELASSRAAAARREAVAAGRRAFLAGSLALFDAHPDLHSFSWNQYIALECSDPGYFFASTNDPDINGSDGSDLDDGREYDGDRREWVQVRDPSPEARLQTVVAQFLRAFDWDDLEGMFGEGYTVTVHREGRVEFEEYYE